MREGIIYGYRAIGDFGSFADGLGHAYYFGRSSRRAMLQELHVDEDYSIQDQQKFLLRTQCSRTGLHTPSRVLLWFKVDDVCTAWDQLKEDLRFSFMNVEGHERPEVTQQMQLGDQWFTVGNMGPEQFGEWVRAVMLQRRDERHEARMLAVDRRNDAQQRLRERPEGMPANEEVQPPVELRFD